MTSIPGLSRTLQTLFSDTADQLARACGFVQRARTRTGSVFALTLVFGFLDRATATLHQVQQLAATAGVGVSRPAIAQRCSEDAATCLQQVLAAAVHTRVSGAPTTRPLRQRFAAVLVLDRTTIRLPVARCAVWRGSGGSDGFAVTDGKASDQQARRQTAPRPRGALRLSDQGSFRMAVFRAIVAAGARFRSRPVPELTLPVGASVRRSRARFLQGCRGAVGDLPVVWGGKEPLACRLIAVRAPGPVVELRRGKERTAAPRAGRAVREPVLRLAAWTVVVSSLGPAPLTPREALVLRRWRWQVERGGKRWNRAGGKVAAWRTATPWQALCTVAATLLACVVAQWLAAVLGVRCRRQRRTCRPASFPLRHDPSLQPVR